MENITISNYDSLDNSGNTVNLSVSNSKSNSLVEIKLPDKNLNYGDGIDNFNNKAKNIDNNEQYLVTSTTSINNSISEEYSDYYLNYDSINNSITWKPEKNKENNQKLVFNNNNDETFTLNTCIYNCGMNQISWNTNQNYDILDRNNKQLYVEFTNYNDIDLNIIFNVEYLKFNSEEILKTTIKIVKDNIGYKCINKNDEDFNIFQLNYVEIEKFIFPINKGDIRFYFLEDIIKENSIEKMNIYNDNILSNYNKNNLLNLKGNKYITLNHKEILEGNCKSFFNLFLENYEYLYSKNFNDLFKNNNLFLN